MTKAAALLGVALVTVPAAVAAAQSAADVARYTEVIRNYQRGDAVNAFEIISAWSRRDLQRMLRVLVANAAARERRQPADAAQVLVREPLGSDFARVAATLSSLTGRGPTAIRDAVHLALQPRPDDESRPVVLVFTDGEDNSSGVTKADSVASARRAGVVIHAVSLFDNALVAVPQRLPSGPDYLNQLVRAAGGRHWEASDPRDLQPLFVRALDEMRARYLLTYYPQGVSQEAWHELRVALKNGCADIAARPGYFVGTSGRPSP